MQLGNSKNKALQNAIAPVLASMEVLENRQMMSLAPWSTQDIQIGLDQASINYPNITGKGQTVAVIDMGVDYNHPALGNGYGNKIIDSWNFDTGSYDVFPHDGNAHGTGTVGQIAADAHVSNGVQYQGVAPGAKIVALRASGTYNEKLAFDWIIANRTKYNIVAVNFIDQTGADLTQFASELQTLNNQGVFMAGAAGNYGPGPIYGYYGNLIHAVGSVNGSDQVSTITPRGPALEFLAPAENIFVTWYYSGVHADLPSTGTSWAAPQVTGAAALIKQVNGSFTSNQVFQIIRDSATWVYDSYSNTSYPRLNVNAAIGLAYARSGQTNVVVVNKAVEVTPPPVVAPPPAPVIVPVVAPIVTPVVAKPVEVTNTVAPVITKTVAPTPVVTPPVAVKTTTPPAKTTPAKPKASIQPIAPFSGNPFSTASIVPFANYDNGPEGASHHDLTAGNDSGDNYRQGNIDTTWNNIEKTEVVGWTQAGEWMNYSMTAAKSGSHTFYFRSSNTATGGSFHLEVDGKTATASIPVPNTGSFNKFSNQSIKGLKLTAGKHAIRIVMDTNSSNGFVGNLNWFTFSTPTIKPAAGRKK